MFTRARAALACLALLAAPALAGCGDDPAQEKDRPAATDWTPAPEKVDGLSVLAASDKDGFRLHTASGDKTFLPGVNLGSTTPLHQPGEVGTIEAEHYQRWFDEMGDLGIRVVRIYTLHPPAFYDELAAYNEAHADAPLYLVQGAYLPNEEYNQPGRSLYDADIDGAFRAEIKDLSDAVHGDLVRKPDPGHGRRHLRHRRVRVAAVLDHRRRVGPAGRAPDRHRREGPPVRARHVLRRHRRRQPHRALDRARTWTTSPPSRRSAAPRCRSRWPTGRPPTR